MDLHKSTGSKTRISEQLGQILPSEDTPEGDDKWQHLTDNQR